MSSMKDLHATNIVTVTPLSDNINLHSLYDLLTIVGVDFVYGSKSSSSSRVKIPYFGVEGAIVSVRFNNKSRGIRNEGGQLRNVVAIDLQYAKKNIHLKVSESKLTSMGALTEEMGEGANRLMLEHIAMVQGHWSHLHNLPKDVLSASLEWLGNLLHCGDNEIRSLTSEHVQSAFAMMPPAVDYRSVMFMSMYAHEYKTYTAYAEKIKSILNMTTPIYTKMPSFGKSRVCNAVYNYSVGTRVSLITLCKELLSRGYWASYHNWSKSKSLHVMIPIVDEDADGATGYTGATATLEDVESLDGSEEEETKVPSAGKNKMPAHRFMIYQSGSIRQSSPTTHSVAEEVKRRLVTDIVAICK